MPHLHFTKKDFRLEWFSGSGAGGQYRNKHRNCCRITHLETGLRAQSTAHRERSANQRAAFECLARRLVAYYAAQDRRTPRNRAGREVIRVYSEPRNEVLDKASGRRMSFRNAVIGGDLAPMIEARLRSMACEGKDETTL